MRNRKSMIRDERWLQEMEQCRRELEGLCGDATDGDESGFFPAHWLKKLDEHIRHSVGYLERSRGLLSTL